LNHLVIIIKRKEDRVNNLTFKQMLKKLNNVKNVLDFAYY
jgi:hypothetical protein